MANRIRFQIFIAVVVTFVSYHYSFAQDEFYNRDSSGYTYRMGLVPPKIEQDWQLGTLGVRLRSAIVEPGIAQELAVFLRYRT
mgnify:CR=1 FL=1